MGFSGVKVYAVGSIVENVRNYCAYLALKRLNQGSMPELANYPSDKSVKEK
jgi:hypothetical protein